MQATFPKVVAFLLTTIALCASVSGIVQAVRAMNQMHAAGKRPARYRGGP